MIDEMHDAIWSVYVHTNKINNKYYVGITSKVPEKRWQNGFGYYGQPFYKAIKKYGWDNFDHEIIASHLTKEEAENFEKILIQKLDSFIKRNGYNVSIGGGVPVNEKSPVYQFDMHGNLIKEYDGICQVERELNIPSSNITACCQGKVSHTYGFIWRYKKDVPDLEKFKNELDISIYDIYEPIYQFDMDKNFIAEYKSASDAMKQNPKWFSSSILDNCRGKIKHACGYIWRFKKDVPDILKFKDIEIDLTKNHWKGNSVLQFGFDGNFIREFDSVKDAAKIYNCTTHTIGYACSGRTKSSVGFLWRYKKDYNGEKITYNPYTPKRKHVLQFDLNNNFIAEYESLSQIEDILGFKKKNVGATCNGWQKTAYGYIWRYLEEAVG